MGKNGKVALISVGVVLLIVAIIVVIIFATKTEPKENFLQVEIKSNMENTLQLSSDSKNLAPNSVIIDRPVQVFATKESSEIFIRAKITYESNSNDDRVLSFVSQLNKYVGNSKTYSSDNYSWVYKVEDNSFYLVSTEENLKTVSKNDINYIFVENLTVPSEIEQVGLLNSDGNNVQVGEDILIKIKFEAVQSSYIAGGKTLNIKNTREYFNRVAYNKEGDYTSLNGYIVSYSGNAQNLILPKYVQNDYIIGVDKEAFSSTNLQNLIVPGSYIAFKDNAFSNCVNLKTVALKNYFAPTFQANSFSYLSNMKIYVPNISIDRYRAKVANCVFSSNITAPTLIENASLDGVDTFAQAVYMPNITEIEGDFKSFTNLKLIFAPNLTTINESMFEGLRNLIVVDTPNVLEVQKEAFKDCSNLLVATFSKKLNAIGELSFNNCSSLLNIDFVQNLSSIPYQAFRGCRSVKNIDLMGSELVIGNEAFYDTSLKNVYIYNLKSLGGYVFSNCTLLQNIRINSASTNLSVSAENNHFYTYTRILFTSSNVKESFITVAPTLTQKCVLLEVSNKTITRFEGDLTSLNLLEVFKFDEVNKLGDNLFKDNIKLRTLTIGSNITMLGNNVFDGSSVQTLTINSYQAPSISEKTFENTNQVFLVKVPSGVLTIFQTQFEGVRVEAII